MLDSGTGIGLSFMIFIRVLLISSLIAYYFGFFLPDWLANILIQHD
ncbi:MAG: hypothetical protein BAJALOKI3v1_130027 [Promethearchaeota archaeon]|nr:MAG: hypothetical protein BAJALOKI3v1_130027 [Candidatus Lokiarchaeota archaeon]